MLCSYIVQICIHTENDYIYDNPGILTEVFAQFRGTEIRRAHDEYNTYNRCDLMLDGDNTFDEILLTFANKAGFIYSLNEYNKIVKPAILTDKHIFYVNNRALTIQFARKELHTEKFEKVLLVFNGNSGEVYHDKYPGYTFMFHSREDKRHRPHIHADYKHEQNGSFNITSGEMIAGNMSKKHQKEIKQIILSHAEELSELWVHHVNGFTADLNKSLLRSR